MVCCRPRANNKRDEKIDAPAEVNAMVGAGSPDMLDTEAKQLASQMSRMTTNMGDIGDEGGIKLPPAVGGIFLHQGMSPERIAHPQKPSEPKPDDDMPSTPTTYDPPAMNSEPFTGAEHRATPSTGMGSSGDSGVNVDSPVHTPVSKRSSQGYNPNQRKSILSQRSMADQRRSMHSKKSAGSKKSEVKIEEPKAEEPMTKGLSTGEIMEKVKEAVEAAAEEKKADREDILGMNWDDPKDIENYEICLARMNKLPEDWIVAFDRQTPGQQCHMKYKMGEDMSSAQLHMVCVVPNSLVDVLVSVNEVTTWTKWHPICTKHERTGKFDAFGFTSHYEQSIMFGAYKSEQNTVTKRWMNRTRGIYLQDLRTLQEGEEGYFKGKNTREDVSGTMMCIPLGPQETIFCQRLNLNLPMKIPSFVEKFATSQMSKQMVAGIYANALMARDPKKPFLDFIQKDVTGLYKMMDEMSAEGMPRPHDYLKIISQVVNIEVPEEKKAARSSRASVFSSPRRLMKSLSSRGSMRKSRK